MAGMIDSVEQTLQCFWIVSEKRVSSFYGHWEGDELENRGSSFVLFILCHFTRQWYEDLNTVLWGDKQDNF